jgi:hypothetical protein
MPADDRDVEVQLERVRTALGHGSALGQALLTAGVALAARDIDAGVPFAPFPADVRFTPTDVALVVCSMLEAADIDMPQLAMWQALGMAPSPAGGPE